MYQYIRKQKKFYHHSNGFGGKKRKKKKCIQQSAQACEREKGGIPMRSRNLIDGQQQR